MEKSKINSQDLIEKSGGGDLIFHTALPAKVVFDLQRFANITVKQSGGKTDLEATAKISDALYAYTLGRSNSKASDKSAGDTVIYTGSDKIQFAPLGNSATSGAQSYDLHVYSVSDSGYRIAIDGELSALTADLVLGGSTVAKSGTAYAGIAINNTFNNTASFAGTYTAKEFSAADVTSDKSGTGYSSSQFDGTYKGLWFEVGTAGDNSKIGMALEDVATGSSNQTYSLDFYDVQGTDGTYHVKGLAASKEILAVSANTYTFDGITNGETEAYNFNGVAVSATGKSESTALNKFTLSVDEYSTSEYTASFTLGSLTSNTAVAFAFDSSHKTLKINNGADATYSVTGNSGTLTFSKLGDTSSLSTILLGGKGNFSQIEGTASNAYGLDDGASGTFTVSGSNKLLLDIDGFGTAAENSAYDIMSFTGTANVFAIAGNSEVTIYGDGANVTATGSSVYKLAYNLSDTTKGVTFSIGDLTFTDAKNDNQNTFISFADNNSSTIKFNGTFTVAVKDGQTYGISDTNGAALSWIKFGADSSTLTIGSGVAIGGTFNSVLLSEAGTDTIKNGTQLYNFTVKGTSNETKNKATFFNNTKLTSDTSHVFSPAVTTASGVSFGENLSLGTSTLAVSAGTAQVFGDFFFGASAASGDTASGTVLYKAASDITLTGGTLDISGVSGTTLIGLSGSNTFKVQSTGANFYLRDGGTGTTINSITFSEISDSKISKLAYTTSSSGMTIFGNVSVTAGSGTKMNYLLGSGTSTNSIAFGDLQFIGTGTSTAPVGVGMGTANTFGLSATGKTSVLTLSGTSLAASTYALGAGSSGTFKFGAINIGTSGTGLANSVNVLAEGALTSATALESITIGGGVLSINDAGQSDTFSVALNSSTGMLGATIYDIDSGAQLFSVASATTVITNGFGAGAEFVFSGTQTVSGENKAAYQKFTIAAGDTNGVTFLVDSATGIVKSITGLEDNAVVAIEDRTGRDTLNTWTETVTAGSWTMTSQLGIWKADQAFLGYIVGNTATSTPAVFTILGVDSSTDAHQTADHPEVVGSGTSGVFNLNDPFGAQISGATATSVLFTNAGTAAYGAKSGTTVLFTGFTGGSGNSTTGLLYSSDSNLSFGAIGTTGTANALTSLEGLSGTTLSMTLGGLALSLESDYVVSGTGVALSANSALATISASTGSDAYISAPLDTAFAFGSTTGVYNIYSDSLRHSLTVSASGANQAFGSNTDIFSLSILPGALVTDTFKADGTGDSSLKVNGALYGLAADSGTLVVAGGTKDTATFVTGTFSMAFADATNTALGFANNAGLLFDGYSYTGKAAATSLMTLGGNSATQIASIAGTTGEIEAKLAQDKAFTFWLGTGEAIHSATFTALSGGATYNLLGDSSTKNAFVGGSATGVLNFAGKYEVAALSDTFTMASGGTVTLVHGTTYASQSATALYTNGTGSDTFTTFALSDYYFATGTSTTPISTQANATVYNYSGTGVVLSLNLNNGSETINVTSGQATRTDTTIGNDAGIFTFDLVTGTGTVGVTTTYTAVGNAFTFMINSDSKTAAGSFYGGSGTRLVGADGIAISNTGLKDTNYFTFNNDSYTTLLANSVLGISVDAGKGTETFVSGSAMFTAPATTGIFHFDINGSETGGVQAYSATKTISLYAGFGSDTTNGTLYSIIDSSTNAAATGEIGSRILGSTATETKLYWNDSYTLQGGATVGLSVDANLGSTETVKIGTATYKATAGTDVFHIDKTWAGSGTKFTALTGKTYSYTAVQDATLAMYIDNGSYTAVIQSGFGTRSDADATSFTFTVGSTVNTYTKLADSSLIYSIDNSSTSAFGTFYAGTGTRQINATTAVSDTGLSQKFLTLANNSYTQLTGATLQLNAISPTAGTETFVSGSATFTAAVGDTFFAIASGMSKAVAYRAGTDGVSMSAGFTSISDGTLFAASGIGSRTLGTGETATYVLSALSETFTMTAGNATITLSDTNLANNIYGIEQFTSGTGTRNVATIDETFALNDYFLGVSGASSTATPYVYTASTTGVLTLNMAGVDSQTITIGSDLVGTRKDGQTGDQIVYDPDGTGPIVPQTYSLSGSATYKIAAGDAASGTLFAATLTRPYTADVGTNTTAQPIAFRGNEYTASAGTLTLNIVDGVAQSETFTSGSATHTVTAGSDFLFNTTDFTSTSITNYNYSAVSDVTLMIGVDANGSTTGLISAIGTATRTGEGTIGIAALGGNSYTFDSGKFTLTMKGSTADSSNFDEAITSGTGTFSPTTGSDTALVGFDKDYKFTPNNVYSYTSFAGATFSIDYSDGAVQKQSITAGNATRTSDGESFTFTVDATTNTYYATLTNGGEAQSMSFVLSSTNAATYGAAGEILTGVGYRNAVSNETYAGIPTYTNANSYTLTTDAVFRLGVSNGAGSGSETLYYGAGTRAFNASDTFYYEGTKYTAQEASTTMVLNASGGEVSETLTNGSGLFDSSDSSVTFKYEGNVYHVSGTARLKLYAASEGKETNPEFQSGTGVLNIATEATDKKFVYSDKNTYTLTSDKGQLIAQAQVDENNSTTAVVRFVDSDAKAKDEIAKDGTFYFDPVNDDYGTGSKLYTALEGGVVLELQGVAVTANPSSATFASGSATRIEDLATFTFDGNAYSTTSTDGITLMIDKTASETLYAGAGTRDVADGASFTFLSPIMGNNQTYTATGGNVGLAINFEAGNGTETFVSGSGTRTLEANSTFTLNNTPYQVGSGTAYATLTKNNASSGSGTLLGLVNYDSSTAQELLNVENAYRTETGTFGYTTIVTGSTNTYTAATGGVIFKDSIESSQTTTSVWDSGSATMTVNSGNFTYSISGDSNTKVYGTDGAEFTRVSQTDEYLTGGYGTRNAEAGDVANFTYTFLNDAYTAAAGGTILLSSTGVISTTLEETYSAGSATFTAAVGDNFHFVYGGNTNTYTASSAVNFTAEVKDGTPDYTNIVASGAGTRGLGSSETQTVDILTDEYTLNSGTFSLSFANGYANASETLTEGAGTFSTTDVFHVSDKYLGNGTGDTVYTYTALGTATLGMTRSSGTDKITSLTGVGTRSSSETSIADFNGKSYDTASSIFYAISSSTSEAKGYLYSGFGTRLTAQGESSETAVFNYDTFTVSAGATMVLTISSGTGVEAMTKGTGAYTANNGDLFHFGDNAYTAINGDAVLTLNFTGSGTANELSTISGSGTRFANAADVTAFTTTFQADTYNALAGSSTILFTATGSITDTDETLVTTTGFVRNDVENNEVFHTDKTGAYEAYTASGNFTIDLSLSDSVQSFSGNVDAYRTASDTTFEYGGNVYTSTAQFETYSLTGSGTGIAASALTYALDAASGTRTVSANQTQTSLWNNTYTLTDGTYSINITDGSGTDTLTAASGKAEYTAGGTVYYGDSNTAYIANMNGATLTLNVSGDSQTEALTQGAINFVDGSSATYLIASEGFTVGGAGANVVLTAPDANSETLVTVKTANNYITSASGSLSGEFESGGTLNVNAKAFTATAAGTLNINSALDSYTATAGTFKAVGDFENEGNITLAGGKVGITGDTEVAVAFGTTGITELESLTGGVTVTDAAGATKAVTDSSGTFIFQSNYAGTDKPTDGSQYFTISGDNSVTFQIDSATGLVKGISALDSGAQITIIDTGASETNTISGLGQVMSRNAETGKWITNTVVATAYIASVVSEDNYKVYAVDDSGALNEVQASRLGTITADTGAVNITFSDTDTVMATPVYVINDSTDIYVNTNLIDGIGKTSGNAAVQITSSTVLFNAGTLDSVNGYTYETLQAYSIVNGKFSVDATGGVDVGASLTSVPVAIVAANDASVDFVATTDTAQFALNDSAEVALTVADSDGVGNFGAVHGTGTLSGLNPSGVETGTAVVATNKEDSDTTTTFSIGDAEVKVTNDNDSDGMTLAIEKDLLVGISAVSTDATINVSGLDTGATLTVGEDNVTLTGDDIKHNKTLDKWISGEAPSIEAAAYLVSVDSANNNQVKLWVTPKDATDTTKQTTNRADYVAVFGSALAPTQDDGDLPEYSDGITIQSDVASIPVSVAAPGNGINVTNAAESKDLILITANGNYTVNGQEIIPSALATVTALSDTAVQATLSATASIGHGGMTFNATSDTATATFGKSSIALTDKAKVTNTAETATFLTNGTVTFDSIAVVGSSAAISGLVTSGDTSGLTANGEDLTIAGGDLAYTVNVTDSTSPTISGIDAGSTVSGAMANDAYILTASAGNFKIAGSDIFSISGDDEVKFQTSESSVVAIESLSGSVGGNFTDTVTVDGGIVKVLGDTSILVSANGTAVSEISNVGVDSTDVTIANAGGATLVNTDANGGFYFGESDTHYFKVSDSDSAVSFITAKLANDVPTVNGVQGLNTGTIEIGQAESGFLINSDRVTLSDVSNNVTVAAVADTITAVSGLQGLVNGLQASVLVGVVDSDVTINGAALQVNEGSSSATLAAITTADGFDTVTGLNKGAIVTTAKNAYIVTEDEGAYTFNSSVSSTADTYTITGDSSVTFETDENSRVKNIGDFAGTLNATTTRNTVNGAVVEVAKADTDSAVSDVTIASAGAGVSSVLGLASNDSVTVPVGTHAQVPASASSDTATTLTVNGKPYTLANDADGVEIIHGSSIDTITTLSASASLTVGAAGSYFVNDTLLTANIGDVIIGDPEGSAHVYDPSDMDLDDSSSTEDVVSKFTGLSSEDGSDRYVKNLDAENAQILLDKSKEDPTALDGNIEMTLGGGVDTDNAQSIDFSNSTGIKKVNMTGDQATDLTFNNEGGNIAVVEDGATGDKNITLGDGGDIAVIGQTDDHANITAGAGKDKIYTKARRASINMRKGGATLVMPTSGIVNLDGYDAETGAGIQVNNSSIKEAIRKNLIQTQNNVVTVNNGAQVQVSNDDGTGGEALKVNFFNLKGFMTKVGYTRDEGGTVDFSNETTDVVMKGNFTTGGAQNKTGGSVMRSGVGNDAAFGGAGDTFNLGAGENTIEIDSATRANGDNGAVIEQTATSGRTEVTGFNFDYGNMGDRVNIDLSASVSFKNGKLTFSLGLATLILNTSSSGNNADLATSADGENTSKIGDASSLRSQNVLVGDNENAIRVEAVEEGAVIKVQEYDGQLTQLYTGTNSGVYLGDFDGDAMVNLTTNEGTFGSEATHFSGINKLQGGSGNNTLIGSGSENNTIAAGTGNNSIWGGGASNDSLIGNADDTTKSGSTSFFYINGDGRDVISGFEYLGDGNEYRADKINFGTSTVAKTDLDSNGDAIISLNNETDKLRLKSASGKDFQFEFDSNGTSYTMVAQFNTSQATVNRKENTYYKTMTKGASVVLSESLDSANIWLNNETDTSYNNTGNLFDGDYRVLNAQSVQGASTLVGNSNDNLIYASNENSSMWGGLSGSNDTLYGGAGADWFWYGKRNGNDAVTNVDSNDIVNLYDVTMEDIESVDLTSSNSQLTVYLKDSVGGGTLTVQDNGTGVGFRVSGNSNTFAYDRQTRNWTIK